MRWSRCCMGCGTAGVVGLAVVLVIVFAWLVPALQKSYSIDDVAISMAVRADGGLNVDERFDYTFKGSYTRVYRDIPLEPGTPITVLEVVGPDGPMERLPSGWQPYDGTPPPSPSTSDETPSTDGSPSADETPAPWTSLAPEQRPFGYYRVSTTTGADYLPVVRIEAFYDLSDRSARLHLPLACRRRGAALGRRRRAVLEGDRQRLGRADGEGAGRGHAASPGRP